jgi:hypothetical protein
VSGQLSRAFFREVTNQGTSYPGKKGTMIDGIDIYRRAGGAVARSSGQCSLIGASSGFHVVVDAGTLSLTGCSFLGFDPNVTKRSDPRMHLAFSL